MPEPPATPSPTASTTTRGNPTRWNTWYSVTLALGVGWIIWGAVIIGRLSYGADDPVPWPINAIALTGLSVGAVMTFVAGKDRSRSLLDAEWQTAIKGEITRLCDKEAAVADALRAVATGLALLTKAPAIRADDEPTVRLNGRHESTPGQAYASATVVSGGRIDSIAERVERMAATVEAACVLVETSRGVAGASRLDGAWGTPPVQRLDVAATGADIDPELRGYLKAMYDREMRAGDDPPN